MAPKSKKADIPPPPPPDPSPDEALPQEIKELTTCPFEVTWKPVVSILDFAAGTDGKGILQTLRRKDLTRHIAVTDAVLRLDTSSPLGQEAKAVLDAHIQAGNGPDSCTYGANICAKILEDRFTRDQVADWRVEVFQRRSRLQAAQEELQAAEAALAAANDAVVAAADALAAYHRAVEEEAARRAALAAEEAEAGGAPASPAHDEAPPPPDREPSQEELALETARSQVLEAEVRVREKAEIAARQQSVQNDPFVCYQTYTLSGLNLSLEAVKQALAIGTQLRAVVWVKPAPPTAGGEEGAAPEEQDPPPEAPEWFSEVKAAAEGALWDDLLARLAPMEVEVPPYVPPVPKGVEEVDTKKGAKKDKGSPAAAAPAKGAKGKAAAAAATTAATEAAPGPPEDSPGFDTVSDLLHRLASHVRTYEEWRASVKVYDCKQFEPAPPPPPEPEPEAQPAAEQPPPPAAASSLQRSPSRAPSRAPSPTPASRSVSSKAPSPEPGAAAKAPPAAATPPPEAPADGDATAEGGGAAAAAAEAVDKIPPFSLGYYGALLDSVPAERMSVPLVMHALLEQVARNMASVEAGEDLTETTHVAAAETSALAALEGALAALGSDRQAAVFAPQPEPPVEYSLILEGDPLAAAAAGLTTGYVHSSLRRPDSPTSPLDAAAAPSGAASVVGVPIAAWGGAAAAVTDHGEGSYERYGTGPEGLFTHTGTLDVEAVEAHMLKCMSLAGANAFADAAAAAGDVAASAGGSFAMGVGLDPLSKSLRRTALQAEAADLPVATIERYQLLQAAADLLPPSAKLAHEDALLARHWHEPMDTPALKQALITAVTELPCMSSVYYGPADSVVVACYAGDNLASETTGVPVAMNLAAFVRRAIEAEPGPVDLPSKVYKMDMQLAAAVEAHRRTAFLYTETACVVAAPMPPVPRTEASSVPPGTATAATAAAASAAEGPLPVGGFTVTRGATTLRFRDGSGSPPDAPEGEGPLLLATVQGGSVLSAFHVLDPEELAAAAAAAAAAATAAASGEGTDGDQQQQQPPAAPSAESSESMPSPPKPMMSAAEALKAGLRGELDMGDEEEDEEEGGEGDLDSLLNRKRPPVTAVQITTPAGHLVRMTTDGQVLVTPAEDPSIASLPPFRGVAVHGAPLPGADLGALRAPLTPNIFRAITKDGLLVSAAAGDVTRVLCPDGSVSERTEVEGWLSPDGSVAKGWKRTRLDGTRVREPDAGSKPKPPPPPPPEPEPVQEPEKKTSRKKSSGPAGGSARKNKKKEEDLTPPPTPPPRPPPPPPPPPFTLELERIGAATMTDPDTGCRVTTREDHVLVVAYPTGDVLVQDYDGTRLSRLADGRWSVEMDGIAPIMGTPSGITTTPCPGVTLSWDAGTGVVTATLPDGSSLMAAPHTAAYAPSGVPVPPLEVLAVAPELPHEPEEEEEEEEEEDDEDFGGSGSGRKRAGPSRGVQALATAQLLDGMALNPDLRGVFLFDPRWGSSAFFESALVRFVLLGPAAQTEAASRAQVGAGSAAGTAAPEASGASVGAASASAAPPGFKSYWPPPQPLLSVHIPELPPAPPPPPPPPEEEESAATSIRPEGSSGPNGARRSGTAEGSVARSPSPDPLDDEDAPPPPRPPTPPVPEPVVTYQPVAPTIKPRVFVIRSDGTGFEVLDTDIVQSYLASRRELAAQASGSPGTSPGLAVDIREELLEGADEEGSVFHSVLVQLPVRPPGLEPMVQGGAALLQRYNPHVEELMPAFRRLSQLIKPPQGSGLSSVQYLPRILAYEPPAVRSPAPLPVLVYREFLELPQLSPETIADIREVLAQQARTEQIQERLYAAAVPHADIRPDDVRKQDAEVLASILEMRSKPAVTRAKSVAAEMRKRRETTEAAVAAREQAAREREMAAAINNEKEKRPWPIKVGPFDNTPKRPVEGQILPYFEAEEGLVALENDPIIREPINRRMLPPRLPPPVATPGAPSTYAPGVYVADRPNAMSLDASAAAAAAAAESAAYGAPVPSGSLTRSTAAATVGGATTMGRGGSLGRVTDYTYPELGHSQILAQAAGAPPSVKTHAFDVYGQPRALQPPLPRPLRQGDAAEVALNEAYLRAEADAVRMGKTASASLIRHSGKALAQFTLTPGHIHMGTVQVGSVAHRTARLANVSTGAARFSVVRPQLPLRVIYKPGPVAAGMEAVLTVEFVAEQPGDFVGEVVVKSELNVLTMTVSAKVVPGEAAVEPSGGTTASAAAATAMAEAAAAAAAAGGGSTSGLPPVTSARRSASQSSRLASPLAGSTRGGGSPAGGVGAGVGSLDLPQLDETKALEQLLGVETLEQEGVPGDEAPAA